MALTFNPTTTYVKPKTGEHSTTFANQKET